MLLLLRTRLAVWTVGALTMGVSVAVWGRASALSALMVAVAMLAIGTVVIAVSDSFGSKMPQSWRRPHETRTARVKALAIALVAATVITGLVLAIVTTLLASFEKRPETSGVPVVVAGMDPRSQSFLGPDGRAHGAC